MTTTPYRLASPLDSRPSRFLYEPFFVEAGTLLRSVRDHDLDSLAQFCDDDFGIVDVDLSGTLRPIRTRCCRTSLPSCSSRRVAM